jgi:hypothetical protein
LALVVAVLIATGSARAEERLFVTLEYSVDPALTGCPTESDFRALIAAQLDYDPFRAASDHRVVARAERSEEGIHGLVRWYDASGADRGERELRASDLDCSAFAKAMGFAIAVQLQLLTTEQASAERKRAEAAEPRSAATDQPRVTGTRDLGSKRATPLPPEEPGGGALEILLGVGAGAGLGLTPRASVQGRAFGALRSRRLALELGAEASLRSQLETGAGRGFTGRFALGSLAGCVSVAPFFGCVVQKLGALEVRGYGVDVPREPVGVVAQSGVRLGVGHDLGPHAHGALRVEALATLTRWDVHLNRNEVWTVPPVGLTVGGDLAALFR